MEYILCRSYRLKKGNPIKIAVVSLEMKENSKKMKCVEQKKQELDIHLLEYICEKLTSIQVGISSLESAVVSVENQLSGTKVAMDKMDKQMKILELKFSLLEKQIVTTDDLEYKLDEVNEYLEEEYSLIFDDLQVIKKEILNFTYDLKTNNRDI